MGSSWFMVGIFGAPQCASAGKVVLTCQSLDGSIVGRVSRFGLFLVQALFELLFGSLHQVFCAVRTDPQRLGDLLSGAVIFKPHPEGLLGPGG